MPHGFYVNVLRLFWLNGVGGVLHHADFYDVVAEKVSVYRARVKRLNKRELYLNDDEGTHFQCDAILCGTGWQSSLHMFSDDLKMHLGLPYSKNLEAETPEAAHTWEELVADADKTVCRRFHILRKSPPHVHIEEQRTPYRLYRTISPLSDDSIVFMNHATFGNKLLAAEAQAMWAVAHFDGNINVPLHEKERDIAMWIAWTRRRYLSNGGLANSATFDSVPYVDTLLGEMGVSAHLDKGWWRGWFGTVWPADLGRAWEEVLRRHKE
jgi:dimethylaniline monooxygenase (N-oxide forming)